MTLTFSGPIWQWRGPAPFYFVTVPGEQSQAIKAASKLVTYGWGMIPVTARVGKTEFTTSLFAKDGLYVVPLKDKVRQSEGLEEDQEIMVQLELR